MQETQNMIAQQTALGTMKKADGAASIPEMETPVIPNMQIPLQMMAPTYTGGRENWQEWKMMRGRFYWNDQGRWYIHTGKGETGWEIHLDESPSRSVKRPRTRPRSGSAPTSPRTPSASSGLMRDD